MKSKVILYFALISIITSCSSKKDIHYFQDVDSKLKAEFENKFNFLNILPGDLLDIQINALNPESILVFQKQSSINPEQGGYLVGKNGIINLPIVGSLDTSNQTTQSFAKVIQKALSHYVNDPTVNIKFLNFKVSVLGEVKTPGTFSILEERVSLPQVLGLAGDLTINADRNILIIRNENGKKIHHNIDLTSVEFMESSFYYLKQNDIVYVRPNEALVKSSGIIGNINAFGALINLGLSIIILLTR
tara:strand:+ start:2368 stop:3105 length:738 start_codon:yes stop_codon:yes gene_type:complete